MTKLRRCSPEIERELHDKEARIRELEGVLRRARQPLHDHGWCLHHQADRTRYPRGHADGDLIWSLVSDIDGLLANSPPDSESAEGEDDRTPNERALEEADDSANYAYPDDTAEKQDAMLERREAVDTFTEQFRSELLESVRNKTPQEALAQMRRIAQRRIPADGDQMVFQQCGMIVHHALGRLSRTSNEGGAPEAIRRLPEALRAEASGSFRSDAERIRDAVKREIANRLDRAIAGQGGQEGESDED